MIQTIIFFTIGPPLFILWYFVKSDKFPEPSHLIFKSFILGIFLCFPAGWLNYNLITLNEGEVGLSFIAGFTEETLKFLAFLFFIKPKFEFNEPMDAIVYGTLISLGFATYENLEYVFVYNEDFSSLSVALIRSVSAIPLHAACGVIMGYFLGLYFFKGSNVYLLQALVIPIGIHAFYNYLTDYSILIFFFYLAAVIYYARNLHQTVLNAQASKLFEPEEKTK